MSINTLKTRIKHAYKTEANWSSSNPILLAGEIAISSDKNNKYKIGNGTSTWSQLSYVIPTKSDIGLGNVENKTSATIRGELTKSNVTTALGYTPAKEVALTLEKYNALSDEEKNNGTEYFITDYNQSVLTASNIKMDDTDDSLTVKQSLANLVSKYTELNGNLEKKIIYPFDGAAIEYNKYMVHFWTTGNPLASKAVAYNIPEELRPQHMISFIINDRSEWGYAAAGMDITADGVIYTNATSYINFSVTWMI